MFIIQNISVQGFVKNFLRDRGRVFQVEVREHSYPLNRVITPSCLHPNAYG